MSRSKLNERKIVAGIICGDEKALRTFYKYYKSSLLTFIKDRIDNEADCEEILQDTLLSTIEALRDFSFRSSLFTFICSIAKRKAIDFYRKRKIKKIVFSQLPAAEPFFATFFGPEEAFDEEYIKEKIRETFSKIAPKYKKILKLKYIYGYSVKEIAQNLSITFKSAESRLFRARQAFVKEYIS